MPQVALTTLGCKVNQVETDVIEGLFRQRNYTVVPFTGQADVYVINTCSVTHLGEKKSRQLIRRAARMNPDATVVVTGCYAQISPDKVEAIPGVDVIVGTSDRHRIVDLVEAARGDKQSVTVVADIMSAGQFEDIPLFHMPGRTRAFLKIQEGCTNFCTYCIIPYARGRVRSRDEEDILKEVRGLVAAGYQFKVPGPGSCCIVSVKDSDKPEAAALAWKLHDYGYKIYGTAETARYLNSQMIPCSVVRQMSGARPNMIDLLESGLVDYIISTSPHGRDPHRDSVKFRRKATELSIPCITAMDTARVLVDALRGDHDISQMELVDIAHLHREAAKGE